jgi:hypothetical protein
MDAIDDISDLDGGFEGAAKRAKIWAMRAMLVLLTALAACGDSMGNGDLAMSVDLAAPDQAVIDMSPAVDMRPDLWRPLDGGIREDGGRCPEFPRCMTAADCCNGAPSCIGLAGSTDGYGWCGARNGEPCNIDPSAGPVVYCGGGGQCAWNVDGVCH